MRIASSNALAADEFLCVPGSPLAAIGKSVKPGRIVCYACYGNPDRAGSDARQTIGPDRTRVNGELAVSGEQAPHQSGVWLRDISSNVESRLTEPRAVLAADNANQQAATIPPVDSGNPAGAEPAATLPSAHSVVMTSEPPDLVGLESAKVGPAFPDSPSLVRFGETAEDLGSLSPNMEGLRPPLTAPVADTLRELDMSMDTLRVRPTGRLLGDYELLEEIARGSMGIVYKARQVSLERIVAVKVIHAGRLASAEAVRRFYAEAEAAASLHHPHIVPIYEIGCDQGLHFYSMRYLEGGSLAGQVPRLRGNWREIARLLWRVADAVDYAHRHGVLHRDLKPANILLDADAQPVVSDFGLCQRQPTCGPVQPQLASNECPTGNGPGDGPHSAQHRPSQPNGAGLLIGTPLYMAPELASGRAPASVASDVYSLGAILYELLTGQPPFPGENIAEVLQRISSSEVAPPSRLWRDVPRDLEAICLKCLEKDPSRRYVSAGALGQDLERFLAGEPVQARRIGRGERLWRWCRQNPVSAVIALGALVSGTAAVLAVLTLSVLTAWREKQAAQRFELLHQQALAARDEAEQQRQRTVSILRQTEQQQRHAQQQAAELALSRAAAAFQRGQFPAGLLWLTRALSLVPNDEEHRHQTLPGGPMPAAPVIRTMLAGWSEATHRLQFCAVPPGRWHSIALHPNRDECFGISESGQAYRWAYRSEKQPQPVCRCPDRLRDVQCADAGLALLNWHEHGWKLWNAAGEQMLAEWASAVPLRRWAVSCCGNAWAVATQTNQLYVWKLAPNQMPTLAGQWQLPETVELLQCSDDAGRVVARTRQGVWVLETASPGAPSGATLAQSPTAIALPANGQHLLLGSEEGVVRVRETSVRRSSQPLVNAASPIRHMRVSANGRVLATATANGWVQLWDTETRRQLGQALAGDGLIADVALTPDGRRLAVLSEAGLVRIWEVRQQAAGEIVQVLPEPVTQAEFAHDGSWLLAAGQENVRLYRRDGKRWETCWQLPVASPVQRLAITADARLAMLAFRDGQAMLVPTNSFGQATSRVNHGKQLLESAIDPEGRWLATVGSDFQVAVWDLRLQQLLGPRWQLREPATSLLFSPDGQELIVGLASGNIACGRVSVPLQPPQLWPAHQGSVSVLGFVSPGRVLISGGADGRLLLWDTARRKLLASPNLHLTSVARLSPATDGQLVFVAGTDFANALVWLQATASQVPATMPIAQYRFLHESPQYEAVLASFSPQATCLAVAYADRSLEIWDTQTGYRLLPTWPLPSRPVALVWPNDHEIVAVCADGKVICRSFPTPAQGDVNTLLAQVQLHTGQHLDSGTVRYLTPEQWQQLAWQLRSAHAATSPDP